VVKALELTDLELSLKYLGQICSRKKERGLFEADLTQEIHVRRSTLYVYIRLVRKLRLSS